MRAIAKYTALLWVTALLVTALTAGPLMAADKYPGWELESKYNKLYNVADLEEFKAVFVKQIEVVPLKGMHPGVGLIVYDKNDADKEEFELHLGPNGAFDADKLKLRQGDQIKVRGVFAEIGNKEIFMCAKLKKKPQELKVRRTSDGKPIWTMSAAELAELNK